MAPQARHRGGHRPSPSRAGLRLRVAGIKVTRRRPRRQRHAGLRHQRREDVVHVRRARPLGHAPRPHRPDAPGPPRAVASSCQAPRRGPRLRAGAGRRRAHGGPAHRHHRLPGMHSYEIAFDGWWVPAANLIGGGTGSGGASTSRSRDENGAPDRGTGGRRDAAATRPPSTTPPTAPSSAIRSGTTSSRGSSSAAGGSSRPAGSSCTSSPG